MLIDKIGQSEYQSEVPLEYRIEDLAFSFLMSYVTLQMPQYDIAPHNILLGKALEKVETGEIKRLIVSMPPRFGKSKLTSELFVSWFMGRNPERDVIATTYNHDRANDMGRAVRNLIADERWKAVFKNASLSGDSRSANKFAMNKGGNYFSVGVGGAVTGRGSNLLLIDDPIKNREDAESERTRELLIDWFNSTAYTRLTPDGRIIVIATRWHANDLTGYLLRENTHENWIEIKLPAIAEKNDMLGRAPGEALWPARFDKDALLRIKETVGTREWNALYQQRPVSEKGGIINIDWIRYINPMLMDRYLMQGKDRTNAKDRKFKRIVASWDTAFKDKEMNDPSACTVWAIADDGYYLIEVINRQMIFPTLRKTTVDLYEKYTGYGFGPMTVIVEDKASGQSLIQDLKLNTKIPVIGINPESNKINRLNEIAPLFEAGRVYLPERAKWKVDYETQLTQFPLAEHDDMVDSTSQFLRWTAKPKFKRSKAQFYK